MISFPHSVRLRPSALAFVFTLSLIPSSGCDSSSLPAVSGKVLVDGSPLTTGSVRFVPDADKGNKATTESAGQIGNDGSYSLFTNGKAGASPGWYKVTISASEIPDSSKPNSGKSLVAPKFNDPNTSNLSVEVVKSPAAGAYDLKVSAR